MSNSLVCKEEGPHEDDSALLDYSATGCRSKLSGVWTESVEASWDDNEPNDQVDETLVIVHLLSGLPDIIDMTIDTLTLMEGASGELSRYTD